MGRPSFSKRASSPISGHEQAATPWRAAAFTWRKTSLFIGSDRPDVVGMWIDAYRRGATRKERPYVLPQTRRPVTQAQHPRLADELIQSSRTARESCEWMVGLRVRVIVLEESERAPGVRYDPLA